MKPVTQTRSNLFDGNCWPAAIASLLEVSIESVDLHLTAKDMDEDAPDHNSYWWRRMNEHLAKQFGVIIVAYEGSDPPPAGYSIAVGTSVRNTPHCCVYHNGELAHDPMPNGGGLREIAAWEILVPVHLAKGGQDV